MEDSEGHVGAEPRSAGLTDQNKEWNEWHVIFTKCADIFFYLPSYQLTSTIIINIISNCLQVCELPSQMYCICQKELNWQSAIILSKFKSKIISDDQMWGFKS